MKPSKFVILPLWGGNDDKLWDFIGALPGFSADAVRTSARYLGVDLGVRSSHTQWGSVCPKLTRGAHDKRNAGAPIPVHVALHNTHVTSIIRCRAAGFPHSERLLHTHHRSAQVILNSPWRAFPQEALLSLKSLGFQTDLVDIKVACEATLLHQAVGNLAVHAAPRDYDTALDSGDVALAALHDNVFGRAWHEHNSCTRVMCAVYRRHCSALSRVQRCGRGHRPGATSGPSPRVWVLGRLVARPISSPVGTGGVHIPFTVHILTGDTRE